MGSLEQGEGEHGLAGGDGDVLAAVEGVADGRSIDWSAGLESPEDFAGAGVEGDQVALGVASEHQAAGGREDARGRGTDRFELPDRVPGFGIDCENTASS